MADTNNTADPGSGRKKANKAEVAPAEPAGERSRARHGGSERRANDRLVTVYRAAMINIDGWQGLCIIRNLSSTGMMADVRAPVPIDAAVKVELGTGHTMTGQVIWREGQRFGVRFDVPIDVFAVLSPASEGDTRIAPRMPRISVDCSAQLTIEGEAQTVQVINISQGGVRVSADLLSPEDDVIVAVDGLEPRRGIVRWVARGHAGIAFLSPIPFQLLSDWANARQQER